VPNNERWVQIDGLGRVRLDGNAHTFPGRIAGWSERLGKGVTVSRSEIGAATPDVWTWIDGFLSGNEPEFHEFLGIEPNEAMEIDDEDEAWKRYDHFLETFRSTGSLPFPLGPAPRMPPPAGITAVPWALAGGQVLRWDGSRWLPQQPQPELHFGLIVGTVCDERGHCDIGEGDDNYAACRDCGSLTVLAPRHS
jgi:hypothetical protein